MTQLHNAENFKSVELKSPLVEVLNNDTAMISYSTTMNGIEALDVSSWVREDGNWRCALLRKSSALGFTQTSTEI